MCLQILFHSILKTGYDICLGFCEPEKYVPGGKDIAKTKAAQLYGPDNNFIVRSFHRK
jgi:hypothetical protein